jgi:multiple sugar transport system substrate-binding protein
VEDIQTAFDNMVREFNYTAGAEKGVIVKVTSVTDAEIISSHLTAAANRDPGAPELPDIAVVYPQTAVTLAEKGVLANLDEYFTEDDLSPFVPQFIEEGRLGGDNLYILPVAKSSEVLYLNRTLFDRFSKETGIGIESLATFEGIAEAANIYYEWPGGKAFFYPEGLFNQAMIGFKQLGGDIVNGSSLNLSNPIWGRIWDCYYKPAAKGGTIIYDGWSNYLAATGGVVCATASTTGSSFYPRSITYPDNTKEDVVYDVLPYPVYEGGEKVVFQRGGGACVTKSTQAREYASCLFLNWLTEPERNLNFCVGIGYMPVKKTAFDAILAGNYPEIENPVAEKALLTAAEMRKSYQFYFPPVFDGFNGLQTRYAEKLRLYAQTGREKYLRLPETPASLEDFENESKTAMEDYIRTFN